MENFSLNSNFFLHYLLHSHEIDATLTKTTMKSYINRTFYCMVARGLPHLACLAPWALCHAAVDIACLLSLEKRISRVILVRTLTLHVCRYLSLVGHG